jgi:ATPase subunit of ABC transporter with duplicated ATPase domains
MKEWFAVYEGVVVLVSHDADEVDALADRSVRVRVSRGTTTAAVLSRA